MGGFDFFSDLVASYCLILVKQFFRKFSKEKVDLTDKVQTYLQP